MGNLGELTKNVCEIIIDFINLLIVQVKLFCYLSNL